MMINGTTTVVLDVIKTSREMSLYHQANNNTKQ